MIKKTKGEISGVNLSSEKLSQATSLLKMKVKEKIALAISARDKSKTDLHDSGDNPQTYCEKWCNNDESRNECDGLFSEVGTLMGRVDFASSNRHTHGQSGIKACIAIQRALSSRTVMSVTTIRQGLGLTP